MEVVELAGIGMNVGHQTLSFAGNGLVSTLLLGALLVSAAAVLVSPFVATWLGSRSARVPLRLQAQPSCGR